MVYLDEVGMLGISVGKKHFGRRENLQFYTDYLQNNFERSIILLADAPKIHNFVAITGSTEEEAAAAIEKTTKSLEDMLKPFVVNTSVEVARWNHFCDERYSQNIGTLREAYACDSAFHHDVHKLVEEFVRRASKQVNCTERQIDRAKEYLIEEISMLTAISSRLKSTEIYPGKQEIEEKIFAGRYSFSRNLWMNPLCRRLEVYADKDEFLHPVAIIEKPSVGKTLVARREFEKGEYILRIEGPIVNRPSRYTCPISPDLYIDPQNEAKFLCHSCNPSGGIRNRNEIVAFRHIHRGEEVNIDYAMFGLKYGAELPPDERRCNCGSRFCRGTLGSWDDLPDFKKKEYQGFISEYLLGNKSSK